MYHVTFLKYAASIKEYGLIPAFKPMNWARDYGHGRAYGDGSLYAFESLNDAKLWAAKMAETFNAEVCIIFFNAGKEQWDIDDSDPLTHNLCEGRWLKTNAVIKSEQIVAARQIVVEK